MFYLTFSNLYCSDISNQVNSWNTSNIMPPKTTTIKTRSVSESIPDNNENICALLKNLDAKLDVRVNDLASDLTTKYEHESNGIRAEIQKHFGTLDNKVEGVIKDLQVQTERVGVVESSIEDNNRSKRLNDIVLRGIPVYQNEQLLKMFESISKAIKYEHPIHACINNIFRIGKRNINTGSASPIIVQFTTLLYKREFMSQYFKHGDLKLSDIGGNTSNRIYASDNLTKHNGVIHHRALQLVKTKQLQKVQIRSGLVFITYPGVSNSIKVNNIEELPAVGAVINEDEVINESVVDLDNTVTE